MVGLVGMKERRENAAGARIDPSMRDARASRRYITPMQLDDQLLRYFGTADLAAVTPAALIAGTERMRVDLGLEKDASRRFALWSLLHMLGAAPDLDVAFKSEAERDAARAFMDLAARGEET